MSMRITFGIIVLNGEPFVRYNLRALYPFAHQIIVVEGATPSAKGIATADGHSLDGTLAALRRFREEEDPERKLTIVTAEDEGHPNGFWPGEKDEMSQAYAKRATGNYLWQVDADEFYKPEDMHKIINMLQSDPEISTVSFRVLTFWGGLNYRTDGFYLQKGAQDFHRLFSWDPGYRYSTHRPPTVLDQTGRDLREKKHITASDMAKRGIYLYHYELLFPKQVREKCNYYKNAEWTDPMRKLDEWMRDSYFTLSNPFRVHMVYDSLSWLERFRGDHPPEVVAMVNAVSRGAYPGIEIRRQEDAESLMASMTYIVARGCLQVLAPMIHLKSKLLSGTKQFIKETPLWPYLRDVKSWRMGEPVPIGIEKVSPRLLNGWKARSIPDSQFQIVSHELKEMYAGRVPKIFAALAEAVRRTGQEFGEIVEVGCSTGYYYEILRHLLGHDVAYRGIDYSQAMIAEARRRYPGVTFDLGDATNLPLPDASCDILISGCVLLHVLDYEKAIAESARVSRDWVIFHRTPMTNGTTSYYRKKAYGMPCLEVHFGEEEISILCRKNGLVIIHEHVINQNQDSSLKTYVCKKADHRHDANHSFVH